MKVAILSDIHANLEAFERCEQFLDEIGDIEFTAILGDIVGYGADPGLCIDKAKEIADVNIIGNHDAAVIGTADITYFNMAARKAILWTRDQLNDDYCAFLKGLPYSESKDELLFTHGSPNDPKEWKYIFNWFDALDEFHGFDETVCFVGHSHVPGIFEESETIPHDAGSVQLDSAKKYIVNVGSIGQPRDGDPRLSFAVLDTTSRLLEIIRLEYDVEAARNKIIETGMPEYLGNRLLKGR